VSRLEAWLNRATRRLSERSAAQVRLEIQEHYESAFEAGSRQTRPTGGQSLPWEIRRRRIANTETFY
jgi:hypothetical protein